MGNKQVITKRRPCRRTLGISRGMVGVASHALAQNRLRIHGSSLMRLRLRHRGTMGKGIRSNLVNNPLTGRTILSACLTARAGILMVRMGMDVIRAAANSMGATGIHLAVTGIPIIATLMAATPMRRPNHSPMR